MFALLANRAQVLTIGPCSKPPDAEEQNIGNLLNDFDDNDYTADSGDDEDASSEEMDSLEEEEAMDFEQRIASPTK